MLIYLNKHLNSSSADFFLSKSKNHTSQLFTQDSKSTHVPQSIGGLGSINQSNNISMVDQSSRFIEGDFMSFEPTAEAVSHDPSAFASCANEFSIGPNINSPHYCPAPTVALRPPISQENPTHNSSTTPIIEFPESDPIDPNSFVHSPPEAYFCNNENISNVNVNFELNLSLIHI